VHTAARVHQMQETVNDPLREYCSTNTTGTLCLLESAQLAGVKKFIFLSSIKVNGESTTDKPFSELDVPCTEDPYGLSKWEAEQGIAELCKSSATDYTIVRLPLVYGYGVKANFAKLIKLVNSKIPLPMGAINNKRSLLYIGNLTAALQAIIQNPNSKNKTYLLSDNNDVSTPDLVRAIAVAYGIKPKLIAVPVFLFKLLGIVTRKQKAISRLLGSLQVDSSKIRHDLNWQPPYTVAAGLAEMVSFERENSCKN